MKRKFLSFFLAILLGASSLISSNAVTAFAQETSLYDRMLTAYKAGNSMDDWVVEARRSIAEELGLLEELDERSFLSINYVNQNNLDLSDEKLNLLVEMATTAEEEAILRNGKIPERSVINTSKIQSRTINVGAGAVTVIQMPRVSGAYNGYFSVNNDGGYSDSYGYCAQNSKKFWNNGGAKVGSISEWDNAEARKALYYGPGGPGYAGYYYGSLGADMDYTTFTVGQLNGDTHNNTKANAYRSFLSSKADPILYGYKAYKADIPAPYQDVAFLNYSPVTTSLTISKRSQTDLYSGDGDKYLSGATFGLYTWNGSAYANRIATATDNGNGTYTFHNVSRYSTVDGWFLVKEEVAKAGYSTDYLKFNEDDAGAYNTFGGRQFVLDSNLNWSCFSLRNHPHPDWGYTFFDYPNNVTVTITKKDSESGEKLTGAEFELWAYRGGNVESASGNPEYSYKVGDFQDNEDGTYSITFPFDLATFNGNRYWYMYKETKAPEGYTKDSHAASGYGFCFDANGNGTKEFVVENEMATAIQIQKSSTNPEITENNDCYSLAGAKYTIYKDSDCTEEVLTLETDVTGSTVKRTLIPGTYWIKETTAPKGFVLDEEVHEITIIENQINEFSFEDKPLVKEFDPYAILLGKVDAETNLNRPQGSASLGGAEYTVKFFEGDYADNVNPEIDLEEIPDRTWVLRTNENGFCGLGLGYLVSGDDFYYLGNSGNPNLPLGTLVIQETKAPEGYQINNEIFIRRIVDGGGVIATYNAPTIPEMPLKITITKKQAGIDTLIPNTEFTHIKPDGTIEIITTNENGVVYIYGLEQGHHIIYESKAAGGYKLNQNNRIEFNISENNEFSFINTGSLDSSIEYGIDSNHNGEVTFRNQLAPFKVQVHKINDKGYKVNGAEFTLYRDENLSQIVEISVTANGVLTFSNLEVGQVYYLKETKAPDGYTMPEEVKVYKIYVESKPTEGVFDFYIDDVLYTVDDIQEENEIYLSGTADDRIINIEVVNTTGMSLPATGSNATVILLCAGVAFMTVAIVIHQKNSKKSTVSVK